MNIFNNSLWFVLMTILILMISSLSTYGQDTSQKNKPMKYWSQEEFEAWERWNHKIQLKKPGGAADRREGIMDGNKIRTVFYNYGSVGRPNTEPSIEWPKESTHGYAYEFGPIIGAQVVDVYGDTIAICSEALIDGGDRAPGGKVWGWQPLPQYLNKTAETPAMSNDPESWPRAMTSDNPFYNPNATSDDNRFLWPGVDTIGQISGDLEAFWIMDDRDNDEFEYYPFVGDSSRRGLGLQLSCRLMQFSASLAEDIIFYIIEIKNVSDKKLENVVAGMFGDPHIGGAGDFGDDMAGFDEEFNMVYSWDKEGSSNDYGIPWTDLGWLGFKFLESPKDAEGNELGLTSMAAPIYATAGGTPAFDDVMWDLLSPGKFTDIAQEKDNVFLFGSGYFSLEPGQTQQFSIAIIMGKGLDELKANATVAQEIYDLNYKFTKAPEPPMVTAVPGDKSVTLYWDTKSEQSFDEFFQAYDFEGYKIYKSTDKGQTWGQVLTNPYGREIGFEPMAQFDLDNDIEGLFPYDKDGVKFYLGNNSGLVHTFKDDNIVNGVNYYYAVTAYDSGYASKRVLPVESGIFQGLNMVEVMPAPRVPGFINSQVSIEHMDGFSTGKINIDVLDPNVVNNNIYEVSFDDTTYKSTSADIIKTSTGNLIIDDYRQLSGEPFIFDGLILSFNDESSIQVVDSLTNWKEDSKSTLSVKVNLYPNGKRIPRDLEVRFYDSIVDTSVLLQPKAINFEVRNINDNSKMDVIFFDNDNNDTVNIADKIVPIVYENGVPKGTWQIEFLKPKAANDTIVPSNGDVLGVFVSKPFENIDKFQITTQAADVDENTAKKDFMENVAVVPNPYIVSSSYEVPPPSVFSAGRGERRLYFINLPRQCTIKIFTLNGELIRVLNHEGTLLNGTEPWDLLTEEGLEISYGIYVYHIDAKQFGEKIGKFAIIK